jgi:hypothetical protein
MQGKAHAIAVWGKAGGKRCGRTTQARFFSPLNKRSSLLPFARPEHARRQTPAPDDHWCQIGILFLAVAASWFLTRRRDPGSNPEMLVDDLAPIYRFYYALQQKSASFCGMTPQGGLKGNERSGDKKDLAGGNDR